LKFNVVMVTGISKDVGQNDEKYVISTDIQYIYYVRYTRRRARLESWRCQDSIFI